MVLEASPPVRLCITSIKGIFTEPRLRLSKNIATSSMLRSVNNVMFFLGLYKAVILVFQKKWFCIPEANRGVK